MTTPERFAEDIENRVDYFRSEYELTYAEAIGVLELVKASILAEALKDDGSDEGVQEDHG